MSLVNEYLTALNELETARVARAPLSEAEECERLDRLGTIWDHMNDQERQTVELVVQAGK